MALFQRCFVCLFVCISLLGCNPGSEVPDAMPMVPDDGVVITSPEDGAFLSSRAVQVLGEVGASVLDLTVNGQPVSTSSGAFMVDLTLEEGRNVIKATTMGGSDEITVVVDSQAPTLVIDSPTPGSWVSGASLTVTGRANDDNLKSVTIGDEEVSVEADGSFDVVLTPRKGAVRLRAVAEDETGRRAFAFVSAILGDFADVDEVVPAAISVNLGADALAEFPKAIEPFLGSENLRPLLLASNPATTGRVGIWSYEVLLTGESHDAAVVSLEATEEGLNATVEFENINIPFDVEVSNFPDFSGEARGPSPTAVAQFRLGTASNRLVAFPRSIEVILGDDFVVDVNNFPSWLDRNLVTRAVKGKLETQIESLVADQVGPILEDLLSRIDSAYFFDVLGRRVRVSGDVASASTSDDGVANVTVDMGVFVSGGVDEALIESSKGTLMFNEPPRVSTAPDASVHISMDMINMALYQAWSTGELSFDIPNPEIMPGQTLTAAVLSILAPRISDVVDPGAMVSVSVAVILPPVFQNGQGEERDTPQIELADLRVSFFSMVDGERVDITTLSLGVVAPLLVTENDGQISAEVGEAQLVTDQMPGTPDIGLSAGPRLDDAVAALVEPIIADLTEFGGIRIPTIRDFTIRDADFEFVPGYLIVSGDVRYTP